MTIATSLTCWAAVVLGPTVTIPAVGLVAGPGAAPLSVAPTAPASPAAPDSPVTGAWPLPGRPEVVAEFVAPSSLFGPGHRGVDLRGWAGEPVLAAADGVVVYVGSVAGTPVVSVAHADGTRTTYQPVLAEVSLGQPVATGDELGRLLPAPSHCAPATCLHWGWRRGEVYLDPLGLVAAAPVVLKPWGG